MTRVALTARAEPRRGFAVLLGGKTRCAPRRSGLTVALLAVATVLTASARAVGQSHVVGWGDQAFNSSLHEESFVEVAAGESHTVALRGDGSLAAWGDNYYGQCDVPAPPPGLTYVEVAAGAYHTVARLCDGSVAAWG